MSAQVRLLEELIQKYKGSTTGVDNALAEFESVQGRKATKAEFDQAMRKAPTTEAAPGAALSPQDIQARAAQRPATPPPARSITDLAEEPRDPLSLRPERDPFAGKPDVPAPLRSLQQEAAPAPIPTAPTEAVGVLSKNMEKDRVGKMGKAAMVGAGLAAGGAGLALLGGKGQEAQKAGAPAQPTKPSPQAAAEGKKELKQVVTESKEEYPLSNSLKLTSPEDVGAALRAADKDTPDSSLPKDVRADFAAKRSELQKRMQDAEKMYTEALAAGKEDRKRRDMMVAVASVVERLGLALTSYFAAKQGMAMGAPVASKLQIQPSDANAAFDRSLREYDQLAEEQKGLFSFRTRGIEREQEMLGRQEEKFEAGEQRKAERAEDKALAESKLAEDKRQFEESQRLRREEGEAERKSRERIAGMSSESRIEAANIRAAAQAARGSLNRAREEAKKDAAKSKAWSDMTAAMRVLQKKTSSTADIRKFGAAAEILGIPPEEQDEILLANTGDGLFNIQDVKEARDKAAKYAPGQTESASTAPSSPVPSALTPADAAALQWAQANGSDPKAAAIMKKLRDEGKIR